MIDPIHEGLYIGAPGFEPGTSLSRIMGENHGTQEEIPATR
jgi:hypothetical protein